MTVRTPTQAPDYEITHTPTPSAMISRLIPLITSDATVASYVNQHFGTKVTPARIAELRKFRAKAAPANHGPPIAPDAASEKRKADLLDAANRKFLKAMRAAYPERVSA